MPKQKKKNKWRAELETRPVQMGVSVSAGDKAIAGLLGLYVWDSSLGAVSAVTASQVGYGQSVLRAGKLKVASVASNRYPDELYDDVRHSDSMLQIVRLRRNFLLSANFDALGENASDRTTIAHPVAALGRGAFVHRKDGLIVPVKIKAVGSNFYMPCPRTEKMTRFTDALELVPTSDEPAAIQGDAGALVTIDGGGIVGSVICGINGIVYAAPLFEKAQHLELEVLTPKKMKNYNDGRRIAFRRLQSGNLAADKLPENLENTDTVSPNAIEPFTSDDASLAQPQPRLADVHLGRVA